ncbi:DNA-3-methyladenine glycosylase family protein [Rhizobium alvei]|uniref:DNA-3-methyladenine glycosylase II n=1 Tax=Rhizobium alvei TaxID=1132659 RepID=A0ABT8YNA7_9HYPH|nr:DNA-3-methyladenine glycosylase [Rhizobium alvei]MDO6965096.1 DNA-3-methyladenine glycosylase [Rhizobium alvei]
MSEPVLLLDVEAAGRHLSQACPVMADLVERHGPCRLSDGAYRPFQTLAGSIISQQLSVKAADTIEARVLAVIGEMAPDAILAVEPDALRACGLSGAKVKYLRALSERSLSGEIDFALLTQVSEEEAVKMLVALPGIGPWTAEMFLIFGLQRPDVLSIGDAGLQRASRQLYDAPLEAIADRFRPFRSVASWYLWRHLDATPITG